MIGQVKKWLGIEGVKIELILPETTPKKNGAVRGIVRCSSMTPMTVGTLHFKLIEKYIRGRRKNRLTDEYLLSEKWIQVDESVGPGDDLELPFEVPFEEIRSQMDEIENKNFLFKGLVRLAKGIKSVNSEYRLEVEARVVGTALNPFDRKVLVLS